MPNRFVPRSILPLALAQAACCLMFSTNALSAYRTGAPQYNQTTSTESPMTTPWKEQHQFGTIAYFLYDSPPRIERYDTQTTSWLAAIPLGSAGSAFDVDSTGLFVSEVGGVERFDINGGSLPKLSAVPDSQSVIFTIGDNFVSGSGSSLQLRQKTTGTTVGTASNYFSGFQGITGSKVDGRIYARTIGIGPSDILVAPILANSMGTMVDSPYHGAFPDAARTFANPAGGMVIDDSGTVYNASLARLGSLGGAVQAMAYLADGFVVLRGTSLVQFSYSLKELGVKAAPVGIVDLAVINGTPYSIGQQGSMPTITPLATDGFVPVQPPSAKAWLDSERWAKELIRDGDRLLLVSLNEHGVYPFNLTTWSFEPTIPVNIAPQYIAYAPATQTIYASYTGGAIRAYPTQQPGTSTYLSSTAYTATGLAAAGPYVFAADPSGAWSSHYTFNPAGQQLSWVEWNYYSRQFEWDPVLGRMYFFRDDTSPNDLHWETVAGDGTISSEGESPYHGEVSAQTPIRVSEDGSRIAIGSGQIFESGGLTFAGNLNHSFADATWWNGDLYAVASSPAPAVLLRYSPTYTVTSAGRVRGTPRRLIPLGSNLGFATDVGGKTVIGVLDPFLSKADLAVDPVSAGSLFASGSNVTMDVVLGNNGTVTANNANVTADLTGLSNVTWQCIADVGATGCDGAVHTTTQISQQLTLADGGQVHYHIVGSIPYGVGNQIAMPFQVMPAVMASDPELRNNAFTVRLRLDELFGNGFD